MRNVLAHANKTQRRMVGATNATVFAQDSAEDEVLSFRNFPRAHWLQIHSTHPLQRLNAEIKRGTNVVGIFPNDAAVTRLVGAMLLEQNDGLSLNRRYTQPEGLQTLSGTALTRMPAVER